MFARRIQPVDSFNDREAGPHGPLGIFLVSLRIAEVYENAVAHILGNETVVPADDLGGASTVGNDRLP